MKVLITGIGGLIGSNLADWINKNIPGVKLTGIDDLSGGYKENINGNVEFFKMNILDGGVENLFKKNKFDIIYHFAAYAAEGLSPFMRQYNYRNNLIATTKLISLAIKYSVNRFVFTSSMAVYGNGSPPFDENDAMNPSDPYGISKMACEFDLRVASEQHGLDYCIIRPHNVYGPKQNIWDKYRNVLGIWMNQFINGKPLTIFGDGSQKRAFSYIEDCVKPLWKAGTEARASRQTINLGGKEEMKLIDAAKLLSDILGGAKIIFKEKRHEVLNAYSTWEKSELLLDYVENNNFEQGLKKMWLWARSQPKRIQKEWDHYELEKGLYRYWRINNGLNPTK